MNSATGNFVTPVLGPQSTYFPRDETGLVCLPSQLHGAYTATLLVMINKELLYLHRGALTLIFGPFGADVLL